MAKQESKWESRAYEFDVTSKETEKGAAIVGRPIVYGQMTNIGGMFNEVIERGALDGADLTDVPFMVGHDLTRIPLARSRHNNANSSMRLMPTEEGMEFETVLDTENNATARELKSAVDRGDISGMSFRFSVKEDKWEGLDTDCPTRHILKIDRVREISAVTFPAYSDTEIHSRAEEALESARKTLESAKSDEDKRAMEIAKEKLALEKAKIDLFFV